MRTKRTGTDATSDTADPTCCPRPEFGDAEIFQERQTQGGGHPKNRSFVTTTVTKDAIKDFKASPKTKSFLDLWKCCEPFVRMKCGQKGLRAQEVNDVLADVKIAVYNNAKNYDRDKGRFHAWLGTIASRKIASVLRDRIHYEQKVVRIDDEAKFAAIAGQCREGAVTKNQRVKPPPGVNTEQEPESVLDAGVGKMAAPAETKKPGPRTLAIRHEAGSIAEAAMTAVKKRTAQRVKPRQWQMFESTFLRKIPAGKVCAALKVTKNQIYIAHNRVGKVFNEELDAECIKLSTDLDAYRAQMIPAARMRAGTKGPAQSAAVKNKRGRS